MKPESGTFEPLCSICIWDLCGTWNLLSVEHWGAWTFICSLCGSWNPYLTLYVEPLWNWNLCETWKLSSVKPLCGSLKTLGNLVPGFRRCPKPTPKPKRFLASSSFNVQNASQWPLPPCVPSPLLGLASLQRPSLKSSCVTRDLLSRFATPTLTFDKYDHTWHVWLIDICGVKKLFEKKVGYER